MLPNLVKKLKNRAETFYHTKKNKDYQISYSYVSNQIRKKTSRLIDNFQSGLIDKVDREDLIDILEINDKFRELALEKPEKIITSNYLLEVNYFLSIIQKYK